MMLLKARPEVSFQTSCGVGHAAPPYPAIAPMPVSAERWCGSDADDDRRVDHAFDPAGDRLGGASYAMRDHVALGRLPLVCPAPG